MGLKRVLSSADAAWLVAGSMIGSGIFITPGLVAGHLPGVVWPLLAWLLGGIIALAGAAVYSELAARVPRAGGDYQYLRMAFGPLWGFMNGWAAITLTFSGAAAAQTRAALEYLAAGIPALDGASPGLTTLAAPVVILALTWANTVGARVAGKTTALFTAVPLAALAVSFLFFAFTGRGELQWPEGALASPPGLWVFALGAAMVPIFFTYSGWNAAVYMPPSPRVVTAPETLRNGTGSSPPLSV